MLNLIKKKNEELYSIANGEVISITRVNDKLFAKKLLGDGVAFLLSDGKIYSPCDAEVVMVAETKHAIGLKTKNGSELLIHLGFDTVNLNGEGFSVFVKAGDKVKRGTKLLEVNLKFMNSKKIDLTTPMILTNGDEYSLNILKSNQKVSLNDIIIKLEKKQ
ncbi:MULTISPECIES: PTS sugar transporter subunit IIA [Tissierellales]|jgi:glucose-specific phosphotransferase system IIA component|uniref:PTS glucose transporter subunit IIA n=1 Tax=Acidilutibacter cellobiosedens TaxID=2507161 RepID=A0A410QG81_9FIRM|nr:MULTISPECIES: PTS glucose transporter subunit IIA [Tissierellales]QAT62929.1 PTS glucose transporter subunit IIA [Acidilutibacter cellobiosedens]SCL85594.1 Glucose-specific phosphotransferase enzyme IIA component [Sporanaerobacter sp. PP17-6a]